MQCVQITTLIITFSFLGRPDMTLAADWALTANYLSGSFSKAVYQFCDMTKTVL